MRTLALLAFVVLCACTEPRECAPLMPTCPTTSPPTYAADVQPILDRHCTSCHFPGSGMAPIDLTTYAAVRPRRSTIYTELSSCNMPPLSEPAMTDQERLTVLDWLVCGALDN